MLLQAIGCNGDGGRMCDRLREVRDGEALLAAARRHGLLAILYRSVQGECSGETAAGLEERLRGLYLRNAERNLRMSAQLIAVVERFEREGVDVVPFKGPVLAEAVYGDIGMRQFADVDILVARDDVRRAGDVLGSLGFELAHGSRTIDDALLQSAECQALFCHRTTSTSLELHWRTGPRFAYASLPAEDLIAVALPATLIGRTIRGLTPADTYLVICVHAAHHLWDQLEHAATLARFIRGGAVDDWPSVLDRAAAYGCLRRCLIGAILARRLTGVVLPPELEDAVSGDPVALVLAGDAERHLFDERAAAPGGGIRGIVWQSRALDSPGAAARHLVERAIMPGVRDWEWVDLPPGLRSLYYAVRPVRMAVQYARRGRRSDRAVADPERQERPAPWAHPEAGLADQRPAGPSPSRAGDRPGAPAAGRRSTSPFGS